ncbi:YdcF family protein [Roseomonas sp. CAU 1739]|uniref:YdcF family protein n=1 Tax=Roseomonas sp. CAU 1739 TaxID=3140364 RepID=UPI00325BC383
MRNLLTSILLPPLLMILAAAAGGVLAWRRARGAAALVLFASLVTMLLATPLVSGLLERSLELERSTGAPASQPEAIIILGAEIARDRDGAPDVGPLTLERLRAGAKLQRATGLPVLVTAGVQQTGEPSLGRLMARSLETDFGVPVRWVEEAAADTHENATFGTTMLRQSGIASAYLVTHGWHMQRALESFTRLGMPVTAMPVRQVPRQRFDLSGLTPRPDHLAASWFALREWAGRLVYRLRDGSAVPPG